jgi:phage FluMu protein Com
MALLREERMPSKTCSHTWLRRAGDSLFMSSPRMVFAPTSLLDALQLGPERGVFARLQTICKRGKRGRGNAGALLSTESTALCTALCKNTQGYLRFQCARPLPANRTSITVLHITQTPRTSCKSERRSLSLNVEKRRKNKK